MQSDLFGRDGVGEVRDARDRHFTPDPLANIIVERLTKYIDPPSVVIEPSVGGGAFARAVRRQWPSAHIVGVDIDPDAEGFDFVDEAIVGDWLEVATSVSGNLAIGNTPFTGTTAIRHIEIAKAAADTACFILPWGPLGGVESWASIMHGLDAPANAWPIRPRAWPEHVRETAAYLWRAEMAGAPDLGTLVTWLERWK